MTLGAEPHEFEYDQTDIERKVTPGRRVMEVSMSQGNSFPIGPRHPNKMQSLPFEDMSLHHHIIKAHQILAAVGSDHLSKKKDHLRSRPFLWAVGVALLLLLVRPGFHWPTSDVHP
jgi:hypothetical protein